MFPLKSAGVSPKARWLGTTDLEDSSAVLQNLGDDKDLILKCVSPQSKVYMGKERAIIEMKCGVLFYSAYTIFYISISLFYIIDLNNLQE